MPIPPPGWYADPAGSEQYRWWDGDTWTDALNPSPHARPPVSATPAGPDADDGPSRPDASTDRRVDSAVETLEVGPHSRLARPMAAVVVLALIAVTALGVGAVLLRPDRESASRTGAPTQAPQATGTVDPVPGGPTTTPAGPGIPPGWVDQRTGEARIGDASMTLPRDPYAIAADSSGLGTAVDAKFSTNAPVHLSYHDSNSWFSTVALVHLPADQVAGDPDDVSKQAASALLGWLFLGIDVKVENVRYDERQVSGRAAVEVNFEAKYDVAGLPSTHDDVTVVVVGLPDGSYAGAVSSVPDDAPSDQRTMARAAVDSLSVR